MKIIKKFRKGLAIAGTSLLLVTGAHALPTLGTVVQTDPDMHGCTSLFNILEAHYYKSFTQNSAARFDYSTATCTTVSGHVNDLFDAAVTRVNALNGGGGTPLVATNSTTESSTLTFTGETGNCPAASSIVITHTYSTVEAALEGCDISTVITATLDAETDEKDQLIVNAFDQIAPLISSEAQ